MDENKVMCAISGCLFIKHYSKWFRVLAVYRDDAAANAYMARHAHAAALVTHGDFVFIADKNDMGVDAPEL